MRLPSSGYTTARESYGRSWEELVEGPSCSRSRLDSDAGRCIFGFGLRTFKLALLSVTAQPASGFNRISVSATSILHSGLHAEIGIAEQ